MLKRLLLTSVLTVTLVLSSFLGGTLGPSGGEQQLHAQVPPCIWHLVCVRTPTEWACWWVLLC